MADVVVCFILSDAEASVDGAFCNAFYGLFGQNPGLQSQTTSFQVVSAGNRSAERGKSARSVAEAYFGNAIPVILIEDRSMGRCLNDAFLWAVASDGAAHWLVWDDAHMCRRPFLRSARRVLDEPMRWPLSQLMLEGSWAADLPEHRKVEDDGFRYVLPLLQESSDVEFLDHAAAETWPGFMLTPSWHSLAFLRRSVRRGFLSLKPFPENSFETWDTLQRVFGQAWHEAGAVNGELLPSPCVYVDPLSYDDVACPV
jgi:hypothetical protein